MKTMLSMPSTISIAVSVTSAAQALGSARNSSIKWSSRSRVMASRPAQRK